MSGILLIDAEQPFANDVTSALEGKGFAVKQLDDGKEGLDYARDQRPDLIVLCVELPKMSGYSICNKLKKDADLKGIPLIITSKEATPETFAQHKKLKTRAEDYLIKPFDEEALLEKIGALIPLPDGESDGDSVFDDGDDAISLDAELDSLEVDGSNDLAALDDGDSLLAGFDDDGAGGEEPLGDMDDVLAGLDGGGDALPALEADEEDALAGFEELSGGEVDLGASLDMGEMEASGFDDLDSFTDSPPEPAPEPPPASAPAAASPSAASPSASSEDLAVIAILRRENTDLKATVAELEAKLRASEESAKSAQDALSSSQTSSSSSARELLNLKEQVRARDKELDKLKDEIFEHEKKSVELQEELDGARAEAQSVQQRVSEKDAEVARLSAQVDALKQERDSLERDVQDRLVVVVGERDRLRGEVESAQQERDRLRGEVEEQQRAVQQAEEARRAVESKVDQLEKERQKAEDQLMKAYEQLKSEETLREKAKKAAEVALQILSADVETTPAAHDELDLAGLDA